VGPRSAGADPGPAAYGRGGTEATATDAMVNLGWLLPETFLGGGMDLDAAAARRAFEEGPAGALGMSVEEGSVGAVQILTHSMMQSIEEQSVRKAYHPRRFTLVRKGGGGHTFDAKTSLRVGQPNVGWPRHQGEYSMRFDESVIEISNSRVLGIGRMPPLKVPEVDHGGESPDEALRFERGAWFRVAGGLEQVPTRFYDRAALKAGNKLEGPA